ncbi:MAG: hypothetical protein R6U02_04630 [Alkalibacterium sp.]
MNPVVLLLNIPLHRSMMWDPVLRMHFYENTFNKDDPYGKD